MTYSNRTANVARIQNLLTSQFSRNLKIPSSEGPDELTPKRCSSQDCFFPRGAGSFLVGLLLSGLAGVMWVGFFMGVKRWPLLYEALLKDPNFKAWHVMEALERSKISDRQVCVKWWKHGRWFYGFRLPDDSPSRCVSLEDLVTADGKEVLGVLGRGAIH